MSETEIRRKNYERGYISGVRSHSDHRFGGMCGSPLPKFVDEYFRGQKDGRAAVAGALKTRFGGN